jgi:hypothetical protein
LSTLGLIAVTMMNAIVRPILTIGKHNKPFDSLRGTLLYLSSSHASFSNCGSTLSISGSSGDELVQHQFLRSEAAALSRSLYRLCLRSVRLIRKGNDNDEKEFVEREKKRLEQPKSSSGDARLSFLSMLPPVDRADELRSRAEYYTQYARELFVQESDCLPVRPSEWSDQHVARCVHHLRTGNEHRKWLLSDMKFDDPFSISFDRGRVDRFEAKALRFSNRYRKEAVVDRESDDKDDPFGDDSDDEDDGINGLPSWYKNPRSQ